LPIVLTGGVLAARPDPSLSSIPPPPKITGSKILARQNSGTFGPIADEIETLPGVPPNNNRAKPIPKPASRGNSKVQRNRRSGKKNGGSGGGGKGSGNATVKILSQQVSDIQDKLSAERDLVKELKEDVKHAMEDKVTEVQLSRDRALTSQLADTFTKDPVIFHEPLLNLSGRARAVTNYIKTFRFTSWIPFGHMALDVCNELFEVLECVLPVKHEYTLLDDAYRNELEDDTRANGMAASDITVIDPYECNMRHQRSVVFLIQLPFFEYELPIFEFESEKVPVAMNIIAECALPKNISAFETKETICARLRHTSNTLNCVNYDKYLPLRGNDLHTNSILYCYGIYRSVQELTFKQPFIRDSSWKVNC